MSHKSDEAVLKELVVEAAVRLHELPWPEKRQKDLAEAVGVLVRFREGKTERRNARLSKPEFIHLSSAHDPMRTLCGRDVSDTVKTEPTKERYEVCSHCNASVSSKTSIHAVRQSARRLKRKVGSL